MITHRKVGVKVEIMRRQQNNALTDVFVMGELRTARAHWLSLALLLTFLCLMATAMGWVSPLLSDKIVPFGMALCFAMGALPIWWFYFKRAGVVATVNAQGVRNQDKFVDWKRIQSCEIVRECGLTGNPIKQILVFKDHNGNVLLTIKTAGLPNYQIDHFKKVIECYLSG